MMAFNQNSVAVQVNCLPATESVAAVSDTSTQFNLDALAVSIAAQNNAIAWGATVLAVITLIVGIAGSFVVLLAAKKEAQRQAKAHMNDVGPGLLREWLEENLPSYLREYNALMSEDVDGDRQPDFDATKMGEHADDGETR